MTTTTETAATPNTPDSPTVPPRPDLAAVYVRLDHITPSPTNPRKHFDRVALAELAASIGKTKGVVNPILLRPNPKKTKGAKPYELVCGERRWRASELAGLADVLSIVQQLSDADVLELQLVENLQRADLHPLDEALGYQALLRDVGYDVGKIADRLGRDRRVVYDRLNLLNLTEAAQDVFRKDQISTGHAVILARLKPADQARALDPKSAALWTREQMLFSASSTREDDNDDSQFKPVSTRELQAWVDKHVRFETDDNTAELFPETAAVISQATEKAEKVVSITFDGFVQPEAREGERIYGPKSWKRADGKSGSKECELSVIGVVAAGAGRGEAFRVCIEKKKCAPHWASEQRAAKKRKTETAAAGTTGESRYDAARKKDEEDRQKAERLRQRWLKALPAILRAVADTLKRTPAKSISQLGEMLAVMCKPYSMKPDDVKGYVPRGATAEDLVRHCGFLLLAGEAMEYRAPEEFPKRAKAFGIDVVKILDTVAPEEKATEQPKAESAPEAKAATKKPTPTPAAKKTAGPIARKAKKK